MGSNLTYLSRLRAGNYSPSIGSGINLIDIILWLLFQVFALPFVCLAGSTIHLCKGYCICEEAERENKENGCFRNMLKIKKEKVFENL
jgi:hypothetical protein